MKNLFISLCAIICLCSCGSSKHHSHVSGGKQFHGHSHACNETCTPGIAYEESCKAVFLAIDPSVKYGMENWFAGKCRDLTDQEIEDINNEPKNNEEESNLIS